MAETKTVVTGFTIDGDIDEATTEGEPATPEEEMCDLVITRLRQRCYRAALGAAVDLVNRIAREHELNGGAWL